jgi:hypothetical protein
MYACAGASEPADTPASPAAGSQSSGDICPLLDAGPPPVCPEGCYWAADTKECRKQSGIIWEGGKDGDAGAPPDASQ